MIKISIDDKVKEENLRLIEEIYIKIQAEKDNTRKEKFYFIKPGEKLEEWKKTFKTTEGLIKYLEDNE